MLAEFTNASIQGTDARVAVGINLAEPLELRLRRDHLTRDHSRRVEHRLSFLLDIKCAVLARELSELVGGLVEILLGDLEALFEKHAFAVGGGSRQLRNEQVKFVDVCVRNGRGSLRTAICYADGDDAALSVFRNRCVLIEPHSCIDNKPPAVNFFQIKLLYEAVL